MDTFEGALWGSLKVKPTGKPFVRGHRNTQPDNYESFVGSAPSHPRPKFRVGKPSLALCESWLRWDPDSARNNGLLEPTSDGWYLFLQALRCSSKHGMVLFGRTEPPC